MEEEIDFTASWSMSDLILGTQNSNGVNLHASKHVRFLLSGISSALGSCRVFAFFRVARRDDARFAVLRFCGGGAAFFHVVQEGGGKEDDDALKDVAVVARIEHRKQPSSDEAGGDGDERAAIERLNAMTGAGLGEVARQRGDNEHGFEPLTEQDDGSLDEC